MAEKKKKRPEKINGIEFQCFSFTKTPALAEFWQGEDLPV